MGGPKYIRNELHLTVPIIALTVDMTTVDVEKCKAVGMNDYVTRAYPPSLSSTNSGAPC